LLEVMPLDDRFPPSHHDHFRLRNLLCSLGGVYRGVGHARHDGVL
jgi:hypothetical protein